jgi:hypothetical protein
MRLTRLRFGCGALALVASSLVGAGASAAAPSDTAWALQAVATPAVAPNGQLAATSCPSAVVCVSVGVAQDDAGRDTALVERWQAGAWALQSVPRPGGAVGTSLAGVSCTAPDACTAVGNLQTGSGSFVTLAARWNGRDWQIQPTADPVGATGSFLSAVSCDSASSCTATGHSQDAANRKTALAERWNGRTWEIQSTPSSGAGAGGATDTVLRGVSCPSATACIAVGTSTTNFLPQGLIERWNGTAWQVQAAALPAGASGSTLTAVSCANPTACTGVGNFTAKSTKAGGALAEQWDGTSWTAVPTPGQTLDFLDAVACSSPVSCTAVGQTGFSDPIADRWDGASWVAQAVPSASGAAQSGLVGVACPTQNACFASGSALYASGDGTNLTLAEQWNGDQWVVQASVNPSGATAHGLAGVSCTTPRACMAVGYAFDASGVRRALAEELSDSGWTVRSTPNPPGATDAALGSVSCLSAQDCTAVGAFTDGAGAESALVQHWNGRSWSLQPPAAGPANATASVLTSVSCTTTSDCVAAGAYADAAGTARTLVERWNGTTWAVEPTPSPADAIYVAFNGVACPTPRSCTAVGLLIDSNFNFLTFAEHWSGSTWEIQSTPNPTGTDGPNGTLEGGVSCPTPAACTAVGQWSPSPAPHPGVTLAERWNGATWAVQATPNPAAVDAVDGTHNAPFAGVACPTPNSCTAVGNYDSGDADGDFLALAEGWNGTGWSVQQAASPVGAFYSALHGVSCPTPRTCVAVGESTRYNAQTNTRGRPVALAERAGNG